MAPFVGEPVHVKRGPQFPDGPPSPETGSRHSVVGFAVDAVGDRVGDVVELVVDAVDRIVEIVLVAVIVAACRSAE